MLSRAFIVLWIAMVVAMAGIGMVSPLLPVYVREDLHGPELAVALSFSGLSLTQLAASPVVGRVADRRGPKPLIVLGFLVYGLAGCGYLFAGTWQWVIACRLLSGIGAAAIFPMALTYVGRLAPPGREGAYMGTYAVAEVFGFGIGPLIGGAVRDLAGSRTAFAVMALLLLGTGALALIALPSGRRRTSALRATDATHAHAAAMTFDEEHALPRHGEPLPWRAVIRQPIVQAAVMARSTVSLGWGAGATFLAVYVVSDQGLGTGSATFVGLLFAARALLGSLLNPFTGRLADRIDRTQMVVIGFVIAGIGQFVIPDLPRTLVHPTMLGGALVIAPWVLLMYLLIGAGEALATPAQNAIFVQAGREVGMGTVMALNQTGSSAGFLGGSLIGAAIVGVFGLEAAFRYAGIAVVLGALTFAVLMRRSRATLRVPLAIAEP